MASGQLDVGGRLANYASAANPAASLAKLRAAADHFGSVILNHYSADEAGTILFFGLLSTVVIKFIAHNGILLVPCIVFLSKQRLRSHFAAWRPQLQFFIVYALVLVAFVVYNLFMSGRYVILLNILTMPLIAIGLQQMFDSYPRWRSAFVLVLVIAALANVVSFSSKKTQFREAGQWLAARPEIAAQTYIEDSRTRYFAGSAFWKHRSNALDPKAIADAINEKSINYLVIDLPVRNSPKAEWARSLNLEEAVRFSNKAGDSVVVLQRKNVP
jgi:hypothetical protein